MNKLIKLVVSVMAPLVIGYAGSVVTIEEIKNWYVYLNKPPLNPPNTVFGPVWTALYIMMGVALYLFWTSQSKDKKKGFAVFGVQLILNFLWSWLFFGQHSPTLALADIVVLWVAILFTINIFFKSSKTAGWLLVPYLAWVSFATYLNFGIWYLN